MEENIKALNELSKGACIGMDAIKFILEKVEDEKFKSDLEIQFNKYQDIERKIRETYANYGNYESPQETSMLNKAMTWSGVEMKTFNDTSNSKIAELLLNGTNMGIIEGRKLLNNKRVDDDVYKLIEEYVSMQEDSVENLKRYL